ncbi:aldehyde dehydrogenase family protein, partial [Tsukamurella paurometabola]
MTVMLTAIDPSTGETVREVPAAGPAEIETVLERAESAYGEWRRAGFDERAKLLRAVGAELRRGIEDYAYVMTEEMGKPITEARGEVVKAAWAAEHYADHGEQYLATEYVESDATSSYVQYLP